MKRSVSRNCNGGRRLALGETPRRFAESRGTAGWLPDSLSVDHYQRETDRCSFHIVDSGGGGGVVMVGRAGAPSIS